MLSTVEYENNLLFVFFLFKIFFDLFRLNAFVQIVIETWLPVGLHLILKSAWEWEEIRVELLRNG